MAYDLRAVRTPRLSGLALKAFVGLLESGYTRRLLTQPLVKEAGLDQLRQLALELPPTPQPLHLAGRSMPLSAAQESRQALESGSLTPVTRPGPFHPLSIGQIAQAYRRGDSDPVRLAERVIAAMEAVELGKQPLRALVASDSTDLLRQARESRQRLLEGNPRSLLEGVPVVVKDELDALPYATRVGTQVLGRDSSCQEDATSVARLRAAGALIIGKANMQEIGIGVSGNNPHYGVCRNPYDLTRHSGGSSSGSAAAVATGLCPLAVGADGGGSIRIPAALCGIVGLKPTWGRVSEHGAAPLCWSVAHVGPMGSTVDDVALGYLLMAGPDIRDANTVQQPTVHLKDYAERNLKGIRIGIYSPWFRHAERDVVDVCDAAVKVLLEHGATRHEITIEQLDLQRIAHTVTIASEMLTAMERHYQNEREAFGLETRVNLGIASLFTARDYLRAQQVRTLAIRAFMRALNDVDVILTPSTAMTAPPINPSAVGVGESDLSTLTELMRFATAANLTGLPAISVPAGFDRQGLPVGLQMMGRPWEEHLLLRLARIVEGQVPTQQPGQYHRLLE